MNNIQFHKYIGAKKTFTNMMAEAMKGLVHSNITGDTKDCFIFDYWFSSKSSSESTIYIGSGIIGTMKTNTKYFFK